MISWAQEAEEAVVLLEDAKEEGHPFNVLVTDLYMNPYDGLWLIRQLKSSGFSPENMDVILVSAEDASIERIEEIKIVASEWENDSDRELKIVLRPEVNEETGNSDVHEKGFLEAIWDGVWKRLDERFREGLITNQRLSANKSEFVTKNRGLMEEINLTIRAMKSDPKLTLLLTGESGTGKEYIAKYIHKECGIWNQFYPVDCTTFTTGMMKVELFGHVKGAFTGAVRDRVGPLEELNANGATVFFDEIGDIPLGLQPKLLRLLDNREIRRVGVNKITKLEQLSFMVATNKDLEILVKDGLFREDLFYRVNNLLLEILPLRERKEDIPFLVNRFLEQNGSGSKKGITSDAVSNLSIRSWPGNVRELETYVSRLKAMFLDHEDIVTMEVLRKSDKKEPAFFIPPRLDQFNQRVSHHFFYGILAKHAAKSGVANEGESKERLLKSVFKLYGYFFHENPDKAMVKIKQKFQDHCKICDLCSKASKSLR